MPSSAILYILIPALVCLWGSHQSFKTADMDGVASGLQRQPPTFWASPNQRLTGLATPRGHTSPICWWPTLVWVHWASCFQSIWIPSKLFDLSRLQGLERKAQLCLPWVTHLGMILEWQTCSLSPGQIKPIWGYPLPQTLPQLQVFFEGHWVL
jgi:hypothetical protein